MENYSFLFYVFCVIIFIIIGKIFVVPFKRIIKLIINSVFGGIAIYVINLIGANMGFHIGLNWWTILCTGFLGIPGVILVIILKFFI